MKPCFRIIFASVVICALVSACGPSQTQLNATSTQLAADTFSTQTAQAPTSTATYTPKPTATLTPTPTITPTPTPTFTPTPTKNPLAGEFVDGKLVMTDAAYNQLISTGQRLFAQGLYVYEAFLYDAMLSYSLQPDQSVKVYNLQGEDYEFLGQYDLAVENLKNILELGYRQAGYLNGLCWDLAISDRAEEALPYCEEAVQQDPSSQTLDSRAFAYALLGKYPEAISDFQAAIEQDGFPNEEMKAQRQQWIAVLQSGKNPITSKVLEDERGEQISLTVEPWYEGALEMAYLRQRYEDFGYSFTETTIDGQAGVIGSLQEGKCKAEIVLLGDEKAFLGASSSITNCSHEDVNSHAVNFIFPFSRDLSEMAQAIAWNAADLYYVIEGKPISEVTPTYGDFQFTVERMEEAGASGILVTAKPAE